MKCFQNSPILQQLYKPGELFLKRNIPLLIPHTWPPPLSLWSKKLCLEAMTNPGGLHFSLILHAVLPLRPLNPIDASWRSVHRMCHSKFRRIDHPAARIAMTPTASNLFLSLSCFAFSFPFPTKRRLFFFLSFFTDNTYESPSLTVGKFYYHFALIINVFE